MSTSPTVITPGTTKVVTTTVRTTPVVTPPSSPVKRVSPSRGPVTVTKTKTPSPSRSQGKKVVSRSPAETRIPAEPLLDVSEVLKSRGYTPVSAITVSHNTSPSSSVRNSMTTTLVKAIAPQGHPVFVYVDSPNATYTTGATQMYQTESIEVPFFETRRLSDQIAATSGAANNGVGMVTVCKDNACLIFPGSSSITPMTVTKFRTPGGDYEVATAGTSIHEASMAVPLVPLSAVVANPGMVSSVSGKVYASANTYLMNQNLADMQKLRVLAANYNAAIAPNGPLAQRFKMAFERLAMIQKNMIAAGAPPSSFEALYQKRADITAIYQDVTSQVNGLGVLYNQLQSSERQLELELANMK